jgi:hypothetical protein
MREPESRGRSASSVSRFRNSFYGNRNNEMFLPKSSGPMNNAEVYDAMEKEQEAMVNRVS